MSPIAPEFDRSKSSIVEFKPPGFLSRKDKTLSGFIVQYMKRLTSKDNLKKSSIHSSFSSRADSVRRVCSDGVMDSDMPWQTVSIEVSKRQVRACLRSDDTHTLWWLHDIPLKDGGVLRAGRCNLYEYPIVKYSALEIDDTEEVCQMQLLALESVLLALLRADEHSLTQPDSTGAMIHHCLLIANSDDAVNTAVKIYCAWPKLLPAPHAPGMYSGENALHSVAVNGREEVFLTLLEVACKELDDRQLEILVKQQAHGPFFHSPPMRYYGGTPLSYAAVFNMHRAMGVMLSGRFERIVTLNDVHCTITGFLPIHAVTASGVTSMYDFLLDLPGLPAQKRANSNQRTLVIKGKDNLEVTPLQLAARLGDHRMFKHIMRRRCKKLWKWGPVTQYVLDLTDIDSCGDSPHDVMELITAVDASTRTQESARAEMLLDTFMDGFIQRLFLQKWERFAKYVWAITRAFELLLLGLNLVLAFRVKEDPTADRFALTVVLMVNVGLLLAFELLCVVMWWSNQGFVVSFRKLIEWMNEQFILRKVFCYLIALVACILILAEKQGNSDDGEGDEVVWLFLSFSVLLQLLFIVRAISIPSQVPAAPELGMSWM
ncbi:hypothetical protein AB1Y20_013732 [Prymnesium parvum]|uniref:Chitin synthase n=1 Tax=Prymnesium parvum TaxID=97485 RepID=A0AB34IJT0_PRYPA